MGGWVGEQCENILVIFFLHPSPHLCHASCLLDSMNSHCSQEIGFENLASAYKISQDKCSCVLHSTLTIVASQG